MTTTAIDSVVRYDVDVDKIATITFDDPSSAANTMSARFKQDFADVLDRLATDIAAGAVLGAIVASAKESFFAGGNVKALLQVGPDDAERLYADSLALKSTLRRLETIGVPVVAAINGAALGGGYEICLATHHRIAVDDRKVRIGLPEVTLGLLAGAGGVVRTVRRFGVFKAINEILVPGTRFTAAAAVEKGLIEEVVNSSEDLLPAAKAWLLAHADDSEAAVQPWDRPGYRIPGGAATDRAISSQLPSVPGTVRKAANGVPYPAPRAIISAAVEGAQVDFAGAEQIEARYFVSLATGRVAKAMIQAYFFDMQRVGPQVETPDAYRDRLLAARTREAATLLDEGVAPISVERASLQAGYATSVLGEVEPAGLSATAQIPFGDVRDRLLVAEALEAARCFEDGVIQSAAAANVGAITAIGFPGITGGPVTFMTNHEGGLAGFVARAQSLADAYGDRFRPSAWLADKAAAGEGFPA